MRPTRPFSTCTPAESLLRDAHSGTVQLTSMEFVRQIRDPVHGHVPITKLESAVIDTRIFQRLRYVRQNGLLHFVFPGAVHTRFAHSIGTMHMAGCAIEALLLPVTSALDDHDRNYVTQLFRLAGLLHDVGHCAFSHSIESVTLEGRPLLGTVEEFFGMWSGSEELLKALEEVEPEKRSAAVDHEDIGLVLIRAAFDDERVATASPTARDFATDLCAVLHGGLVPSERMREVATRVGDAFKEKRPTLNIEGDAEFPRQFAMVLHDLISGTLDVDRLDYLIRDSMFCGVAYGQCESSLLATAVGIARPASEAVLTISYKARYALEDMIWARYQMFTQVYNHKTNVGVGLSLRQALEDAVSDARIERPDSEGRFLGFTDDYVMSHIHGAALAGKLESKSFTKALVDRRFLRHVTFRDVSSMVGEKRAAYIDDYCATLATQLGLKKEDVLCNEAESKLVKPGAISIVYKDGTIEPWKMSAGMPGSVHRVAHFFTERAA